MKDLHHATIHILIDAEDEATACDTLSELFRNEYSGIVDWAYIEKRGRITSPEPITVDMDKYDEGDFTELIKGNK
jgi:hypothetical protein